jgi:ribosomal protein S18 acetylase RimI-like enzyme
LLNIQEEEAEMKIRKATKKYLKEISKLFLTESAKKPYEQKCNERTAFKKVKELFSKEDIFIVVSEEKIIGFITLEVRLGSRGKKVYIDELWLEADYRGKGIGKRLIKFVEAAYLKKGIKSIYLISDKRSRAFGFYKKLRYKADPNDVLMAKRLR